MTPARLSKFHVALLIALGCSSLVCNPSAGGEKPRAGDVCVVKEDGAPAISGGKTVTTLAKGQRVNAAKVFGPWVQSVIEVDGLKLRVLIDAKHLEVAERGAPVEARTTAPKRKVEAKPDVPAPEAKNADAEWPQFRGPNRDGVSAETGLLKQWPDGGPKLLWSAKGCGLGFASVSIADGLIYTAGNVGGDMNVVAFTLKGKRKWQARVGKAFGSGNLAGSRATPTIDGDRLYYETPHGDVV